MTSYVPTDPSTVDVFHDRTCVVNKTTGISAFAKPSTG